MSIFRTKPLHTANKQREKNSVDLTVIIYKISRSAEHEFTYNKNPPLAAGMTKYVLHPSATKICTGVFLSMAL